MSGVEIAVAAAVAAATTEVVKGFQSYQQGKAEKKAYDTNAEILRRNAAQKRLESSINEDTQRRENRQRVSAARAAMGEAGLLDSQTALGALGQMSATAEQNVLNYRFGQESEASNYLNQANMQNYYGKMAAANGRNAFKMSFLNAGVSGGTAYVMGKKNFGNTTIGDLFKEDMAGQAPLWNPAKSAPMKKPF